MPSYYYITFVSTRRTTAAAGCKVSETLRHTFSLHYFSAAPDIWRLGKNNLDSSGIC
ncbi:MAG: hypothetical protein LBT48_03145 [Prevotellaceae bacterium]|jgi:hypothetical protein|nr:hypothetical protein [Prevotellaceae bacterium]